MPQLLKEWNRSKPTKKKPTEPVFGMHLEELIKYNSNSSKLPDIVTSMFNYLKTSGNSQLIIFNLERLIIDIFLSFLK